MSVTIRAFLYGDDLSSHVLQAEATRRVNSVGSWTMALADPDSAYTDYYWAQDSFGLNVAADWLVGTPRIMTGVVDNVTSLLVDGADIGEQQLVCDGFDLAQDLMFHDDFEYSEPNTATRIENALDQIFNVELAGLTNITYGTAGLTNPVCGAFEFKEGASFLSTLQDMCRSAGYIFYVDDSLSLRAGVPGFDWTGEWFTNEEGNPANNMIGDVSLMTSQGSKITNYVKMYGKNPMFDAWTELNAATWGGFPHAPEDTVVNVRVGEYSIVESNNNPVDTNLSVYILFPQFNQGNSIDLSKGQIGVWGMWDNTAGAPGSPGIGAAGIPTAPDQEYVSFRLSDITGRLADYYGDSTKLWRGYWGWASAPLGEDYKASVGGVINRWCAPLTGSFDWTQVTSIQIMAGSLTALRPHSHFYIDGFSLPIPAIAISESLPSQTAYRRRPMVTSRPDLRSQNALQNAADTLRDQSEYHMVSWLKFTTRGNPVVRYAGQSFIADVPGLTLFEYYATSVTHRLAGRSDLSGGYGWGYVTDIEAVPISRTFDHRRLSPQRINTARQLSQWNGVGLNQK